MPKSSTQTPPPSDGLIVEQDLPTEMRTSFLEYAYSVIYARALPDARDGLKKSYDKRCNYRYNS